MRRTGPPARPAAVRSAGSAGGRRGRAAAALLALAAALAGLGLFLVAADLGSPGGPDAADAPGETSGAGEVGPPGDPERAREARISDGVVRAAPASEDLSAFARAREHNQRGIAALDRVDHDEAIDQFGRAHDLAPDVAAFAVNLTEAYVRRGVARPDVDALGKIEDFEAALVTVQSDERRLDIEELLARARAIAEAEADFVVESTLHFTFRFDGARPELYAGIEALKRVLEDTYQEYGELFQRRPVEEGEPRIEVVLYGKQSFDDVTGLGDWAGGVFDGTIRVPVEDLGDAASVARITRVLRHETAHAFIRSIGGRDVPAWLNEGLSQWLEDPAGRAVDVMHARGRLSRGTDALFELDDLRGTLTAWSDRARIRRAYDQALAFTAYLAQRYGDDLVFDLAAACKAGGAGGAAARFQEVLLQDLDVVLGDFEDDLAR